MRFRIAAALSVLGFLAPLLFLPSAGSAQNSSVHSSAPAHSSSAAHASNSRHSTTVPTYLPTPPPTAPRNNTHNNGNTKPFPLYGSGYYYPYIYAVPLPYAVDSNGDAAPADDADEQGGPTIFDRRGSGPDSYVPPSAPPDAAPQDVAADDPPSPSPEADSAQPQTTLVFKDGHQLDVGDYVIANQTLYDLTPGHPRKIALADLDLAATEKQNDDRGVPFQIPSSAQAN
ncbi:MAG: hypothetical protein WCC95_10445 [Candidatus Sulfotelmatobacter sp.]